MINNIIFNKLIQKIFKKIRKNLNYKKFYLFYVKKKNYWLLFNISTM